MLALQDLKYVTFNEALTGAKDNNLDFSIRSKYVELIIGMSLNLSVICDYYCLTVYHLVLYVDANDNNRALLENLPLSFVSYSSIFQVSIRKLNSYK